MSIPQTETWRILHIDDDEDDHFIVRSMLNEAQGRSVMLDWAATFEDGRRKLNGKGYQAVLVDYDLGSGSGIDLIRESVERGVAVPMILLTGRGNYEVDLEAMRAGATLYLSKNEINPLLLERAIRYAIEHRQAERDLLERDRRLSVALDAAQLGTWTYTFADHMLELDGRARELYGIDRARVDHDDVVRDLLHPDDAQVMQAALAKAADPLSDGHYQVEYRILQPDGSVRWLNVWGVTDFEGEGENRHALRLLGASREITWEKQVRLAMAETRAAPQPGEHLQHQPTHNLYPHNDLLKRITDLELANQRMAAVLQAFPVAVLIADSEGRIVQTNQMMKVLWGENAPRLETIQDYQVYKGWWVDTEQPLQVDDWPLARALQQGETWFGKMVDIERFDGPRATILTGGAPVVDAQGRNIGAVSVALDITEQRRLEMLAREAASDARRKAMETESVFNSLSDAVLVYNSDGKVRLANAQAIALFGFDPLHLFRETIAHRLLIKTTEGEQVRPQDLPSSRALAGEAQVNQRLTFSNPRGRSYTVLVSALPTVLGKELTGVVEVWHDVTERERLMAQLSVEQALEKARSAELEALMDAVPAAIWVAHDPEGKHVTGNRASYELLNLPHDIDFAVNPLADVNPALFKMLKDGVELAPDQLPMLVVLREQKEVRDWEGNVILPDGTSRYILGNTNPLFDAQDQIHGAISAFIDITELKVAQAEAQDYAEKLERSNYDLEQFAFVASHDLQEPLRKVRFFGERLQEDLGANITNQEHEYIERMLNASQRMQTMISDLLTYSRITTKARPFERVDLMQVGQEVVSDLEIRIESSKGQVLLGKLPVIEADPLQMRQLLLNLISNALKFHRPENPPLVQVDCKSVSSKKNGVQEILLSVKDNGIGFDQRNLDRIFKPFERLNGRSEFEGSGMGLAICRKIVERHHGAITAKSEPGQGSTFLVQIPVRQADPEKEEV